jgi:hypothetical protein
LSAEELFPACSNKKRYASSEEASKFGKKSTEINGVKLHNYQCMWCGGFHLTSEGPAKRRKHRKAKYRL